MGLSTLSRGSHEKEYIRVKNSKKIKKTILRMLEKSNIIPHGIERWLKKRIQKKVDVIGARLDVQWGI